MWIDLTDRNGDTMSVNFDNVTHVFEGATGGRKCSVVYLVGGSSLVFQEEHRYITTRLAGG